MTNRLQGVITPLLTPYNADFNIAQDLYQAHAADCLAQGAHYLSPFGTTSEANSHSLRERRAALEGLVTSGAAPVDRLMPGTGLCSLPETVDLVRHAVDLGCAAALVLPPFFYTAATDEGLYRYFSTLIERVASDSLHVCLYHIPQNTGVPISPALAARLNSAFPDTVIAYKDSSGSWDNTCAVIEAAPGLSVFPGSEVLMLDAMKIGGGGCISGSCNSNVAAIRAVFDAACGGDMVRAQDLAAGLIRHREALQQVGMIEGLKSLKFHQTGDARWLTLRPPLLNADPETGAMIASTL